MKLDLSKPERFTEGIKYDLLGMVVECKEVMTKSGSKMGRLVIEDYNGRLDVTVFAKTWAMCSLGVSTGKIIGVRGSFKTYNNNLGFSADTVFVDVNQMKPERPRRVLIELDWSLYPGRDALREIRAVLRKHRGTADVAIIVYKGTNDEGKLDGRVRRIAAGDKFKVDGSRELITELKECQSVHDVYSE